MEGDLGTKGVQGWAAWLGVQNQEWGCLCVSVGGSRLPVVIAYPSIPEPSVCEQLPCVRHCCGSWEPKSHKLAALGKLAFKRTGPYKSSDADKCHGEKRNREGSGDGWGCCLMQGGLDSLTEMVALEHRPDREQGKSPVDNLRRAFQAEGRAGAKALGPGCAWPGNGE